MMKTLYKLIVFEDRNKFGREYKIKWKTYTSALFHAQTMIQTGKYDCITIRKEEIWPDGFETSELIHTVNRPVVPAT